MPDRNSELENNQDLKFSAEQGFFDKSKTIRYLIAVVFALALFSFLHFREVKVDTLELNSIAPDYIVSQVDFDFADEEATIILKQEAVRDIGKIYRLSEKDIRHKRIEFENFLLYNQGWRGQAEAGTFDQLYHGAETIERALLQLRLTDPRTLQKMKELGVSIANYQAYTPNTLLEQMTLPSFIWEHLKAVYLPSNEYNSLSRALIIEFFKNSYWHVEEDIPAQRAFRKLVQSQVAEKITHVPAGSRIIDQGERVTGRHVAMIQAMKAGLGTKRHLFSPLTLLGSLIMTLILMSISLLYFKANQPRLLTSNRRLFLLVTIVILTLGLAKLTEFFFLSSNNNLIEIVRYPLFVPLAAILLCSLMNAAVATFASAFLAIVLSQTLAFEHEGALVINLVAALVAILNTSTLRRRKEIFIVCLKAWLYCIAAIFALHLYNNDVWNFSILIDILSSGFFMLMTAVLVVGLLPLLESSFSIMTDVSLMEYINPNNDLLRRLTIEAPGTYQHSVVVGNLAEAAAIAIGANGLFCRVATLYHDIGKIATSQYFTENQMEEMNIHQLLTPQESAQVIMSHVPEGVALAREAGLPEPIIDIIKEHHGTTLVYYFYRKQVEKMGGDKTKVDAREFRYAGPKPRSRESGIIMLADSFEAASRSLDKINEESLTELIDRLARDKMEDGQFDHCLMTFEEISIVKKILVKTLLAAGHTRVKYPVPERKTVPIQHLEASA
jgi:putative nucleotidyltransferase with HDIG domain